MKRKAFTLIELMVAVVVIAILMSIVFRLSGIGGDTQKRNLTAARLQRLENCLSGYYAAFGSYPPVPQQRNFPNFRLHTDDHGIQDPEKEDSDLSWRNVQAACRAQPVGTLFPFSQGMSRYIETVANALQAKAKEAKDSKPNSPLKPFDREELRDGFGDGSLNPNATVDSDDSVFEFGLMSFLLPRYYFMLDCDDNFFKRLEWDEYNAIPANPETGATDSDWERIRLNWKWQFAMIPSQSVCARWMPNLEGSCRTLTVQKFFGITISDGPSALHADNPNIADLIRYPERKKPGVNGYLLNSITILDGWGREFYYYSAPPYQSYILWSAGPDGKTFCPWVTLDSLKNDTEKTTAGNWMADDIIQMGY